MFPAGEEACAEAQGGSQRARPDPPWASRHCAGAEETAKIRLHVRWGTQGNADK